MTSKHIDYVELWLDSLFAKLEEMFSSAASCSTTSLLIANSWKQVSEEISAELFFESFPLSDVLPCILENFSVVLGYPILLLLLCIGTSHFKKPSEDEFLQVIVTKGSHDKESKVAKTIEESPDVAQTVQGCVDGSRVSQNVRVWLEYYEADII